MTARRDKTPPLPSTLRAVRAAASAGSLTTWGSRAATAAAFAQTPVRRAGLLSRSLAPKVSPVHEEDEGAEEYIGVDGVDGGRADTL